MQAEGKVAISHCHLRRSFLKVEAVILNQYSQELVIVTGASSGIGKAACLFLRDQGFRVVACVRKTQDLEFWQSQPGINPLRLDVTDSETVEIGVSQLKELLKNAGRVHLINNAGMAVPGPIEAVPLAKWQQQFETNLFGPIRMLQALLPWIRKTQGRVINISSISGLMAIPFLGPYCSSKFALEALSDSLRRELRRFNVKVVLIEPGPIETPIWEKNFKREQEIINELLPVAQEAYLDRLKKFIAQVQSRNSNMLTVDDVNQKIFLALTHNDPHHRYLVTQGQTTLQVLLNRFLPSRWMDKIIAKRLG